MQYKIGQPLDGGFFYGAIRVGDKKFALIAAGKVHEIADTVWSKKYDRVAGACSYSDGLANTRAMGKAGSELAQYILGLKIHGFDDWYIGAMDEVELQYRAFKPTTDKNSLWFRSGINVNAIPPTEPYELVAPCQTKLKPFKQNGAQAYQAVRYWSSTQHAGNANVAYAQGFGDGSQDYWGKGYSAFRARPVRRLEI